MTRAYRWLAILVAGGAVALAVFARAPKPGPKHVARSLAAKAESLHIEIANGVLRPDRGEVAKGSEVLLTVRNRDQRPHAFSLAGYEDRSISASIGAGETTVLRFLAERPGEDFAWIVDGRPAGRLAVHGSHLEEGHR